MSIEKTEVLELSTDDCCAIAAALSVFITMIEDGEINPLIHKESLQKMKYTIEKKFIYADEKEVILQCTGD